MRPSNAPKLLVLQLIHEGMATVLLKSMALGIPVVASAASGILELLANRWNGLFVKPGREDELTHSCVPLMSGYDRTQNLGVAGRKRVEERFSARFMAGQVAELYRTLVLSKPRS